MTFFQNRVKQRKNDEDIFSTKPKVPKSTNFDDELFSAKTPVVKATPKTQVLKDDDDDENIFAPKKKTKSKTKTIFDDDDDIFGSSSIIKDKTTSDTTVKDKTKDKTPKETEKEDIFSKSKDGKKAICNLIYFFSPNYDLLGRGYITSL